MSKQKQYKRSKKKSLRKLSGVNCTKIFMMVIDNMATLLRNNERNK